MDTTRSNMRGDLYSPDTSLPFRIYLSLFLLFLGHASVTFGRTFFLSWWLKLRDDCLRHRVRLFGLGQDGLEQLLSLGVDWLFDDWVDAGCALVVERSAHAELIAIDLLERGDGCH